MKIVKFTNKFFSVYVGIVATLATFVMLAAADRKAQFFDSPPLGQLKVVLAARSLPKISFYLKY